MFKQILTFISSFFPSFIEGILKSKNEFKNRLIKTKYLSFIASHIKDYPTPQNLSFFWSIGSLLGLCLVIQIITGIFLSMHYNPNINFAFYSVEHIMRDVPYGYVFRYAHANGASMLFVLMYFHIFRGLYYRSYVNNVLLWWSGIILFFLMMGTGFLGYVLPWGQMSLWGATVITNLASAIPFIGQSIVEWLWGGFSVDNATLNRFYSFHYVLPFVILAIVVVHLTFLHANGSRNPLQVPNLHSSKIKFYPFYYVKDLFSFFVFIFGFSWFIFYFPNLLGHPDNYICANPMVTPAHIVPEWYFLPFYAILRSIPNKLLGVIAMIFAILSLGLFASLSPKHSIYLDKIEYDKLYKDKTSQNGRINEWYYRALSIFLADFVLLGWIGQQSAVFPFIEIGQIATFLYFVFIAVLIGINNLTEESIFLFNYTRCRFGRGKIIAHTLFPFLWKRYYFERTTIILGKLEKYGYLEENYPANEENRYAFYDPNKRKPFTDEEIKQRFKEIDEEDAKFREDLKYYLTFQFVKKWF